MATYKGRKAKDSVFMTKKVKKGGIGAWKIFLLLLLAAAIVIISVFITISKDATGISVGGNVTVTIAEGSGSAAVSQQLFDEGIIKYPSVFRVLSKVGGYDGEYKPGSITIQDNMTYNDILDMLIVSERESVKVTIPEGYTAKQIAATLEDNGICDADDFLSILDPSLYDYDFLDNLPDRDNRLEGYLFPATYELMPHTPAQNVADEMLKAFSNVFTLDLRARADELGMTVDQVVTFASIIERETNSDTERAKVAGVFYNRLRSGMKLESCATVQYILGENKPVLSVADTQIDSPYNTYRNTGLPIGPISNPGEKCLRAALYPEETDAFYFVLGKNGEHIFSKTYEEHKKAMEDNGL